jgi:anti-sigma factor RsiW
MQSCQEVIGLLTEYLEGGLTAAQMRAFDAHMALCPACLEFLASVRKTRAAVGGLRTADLPAEMHRSLHAFLKRQLRSDKTTGRASRRGPGKRSRPS